MWILALLACREPVERPGDDVDPVPTGDTSTGLPTAPTPTTPTTTRPTHGVGALQFHGEVPSNLLMISVDTFRRDHLDRYGSLGLTPAMDGWMTEGVSFDRHRQCSNWTFPGTSCTILGRYHEDNGFIPQISTAGRAPFPEGTPFLAAQLAAAGFATMIGSNNGWLSSDYNVVQGYETVLPRTGTATEQLDQGLLELVAAPDGRPWFFHAHVTEPHVAYDPPEEYLGGLEGLAPISYDLTDGDEHYVARDSWPEMDEATKALVLQHMEVRYAAEIRWLDDQLRDALARYDAAGMLDDTLVVIWNDHGEQFWEHGHLTHAYDLHGEENDAFLFFWSKSIVPRAWDEPTSAVDLVPTLLALYGITPAGPLSGEVLGTADPERPIFAMSVARSGGLSSVTAGDDRLIFSWEQGSLARFDLASDPGELNDVYTPGGARDEALWSLLRPHAERASAAAPLAEIRWP
jgi:arylsulfatase A-like enzyme